MKQEEFIVNLSTLGKNPTGIGIYSKYCGQCVNRHFVSNLFTSTPDCFPDANILLSPKSIAIGQSRFSALQRLLYMTALFPVKSGFVYSPTHNGVFSHRNQVITILDLISVRYPKVHKQQYFYFKYIVPELLKSTRAIFTISEATKQDICRYYQFPQEKVFVVSCGVDGSKYLPGRSDQGKDFLLAVGAKYLHKNVEELLLNHRFWKHKYKLTVVSVSGAYGGYLVQLVKKLNLEKDVELLGYVSEEQLVQLYRSCTALVYPSLYEGFGLPPLETMACGRPVIVSDIQVHKELFAEAAFFVQLGEPESWRRAFEDLSDEHLVKQKIDAGLQLAKKYTWDRACEKLVAALLTVEPALKNFVR